MRQLQKIKDNTMIFLIYAHYHKPFLSRIVPLPPPKQLTFSPVPGKNT